MAQDPGIDYQSAGRSYYGGGVWGPKPKKVSPPPAPTGDIQRNMNWLRARAIKNKLAWRGRTRLTGGKYSPLSG